MLFTSLSFLLFFPIVLLLYRILPRRLRWLMLLVASYIFYGSFSPDLIYLILLTTVISYVCARKLEFAPTKFSRRVYLAITIVSSLAVLLFFKYFNFIAENVAEIMQIMGMGSNDFTLDILLPIGISFYTFQTISYVVDVYRGRIKAEKHFGYYALFVSFFPQVIAGPIEKPENLLPQLRKKNPATGYDTALGLKLMAVGFFKKIVIADQISKYVDAVFNNVAAEATVLVNGFTVALAVVLFAIQIYCDFSGYTDIAIGCARIMGIKLMQNFNSPYSATTVRDFWRRWHMSLTTWFVDYVYVPMGGSRCGKVRHSFNIMVVFLISGIWHGAAWTFVLWGLVQGVYYLVGMFTQAPREKMWEKLGVKQTNPVLIWAKRVITFILIGFSWILFRANDLRDAGRMFTHLFTGWGSVSISASLTALGLPIVTLLTIAASVYVMIQLDKQITLRTNDLHLNDGLSVGRAHAYVVLAWTIAAAWMMLLATGSLIPFIYFQF